MSIKERSHLNRIANRLDIEFGQAPRSQSRGDCPCAAFDLGTRSHRVARGRGIPDDIWEQMSLLFEGHSKEDLLRQIVLAEMRKLDTGGKADLNQKDMGDRRRERTTAAGATAGTRADPVLSARSRFPKSASRRAAPPMGQRQRRIHGQTRQAHGRRQGQKEGQEEALL